MICGLVPGLERCIIYVEPERYGIQWFVFHCRFKTNHTLHIVLLVHDFHCFKKQSWKEILMHNLFYNAMNDSNSSIFKKNVLVDRGSRYTYCFTCSFKIITLNNKFPLVIRYKSKYYSPLTKKVNLNHELIRESILLVNLSCHI